MSRTLPGLGLEAFWPLGFSGWNAGMDGNLRLCSALIQGRALNLVAAEPGSPTNGDIVLLDETHSTHPNAVAIRDNGAWVYVAPQVGWRFYDATAAADRRYDGTVWVALTDQVSVTVDNDTTLASDSTVNPPTVHAVVAYVAARVAALVNSSPSALDTLKELADALGDDANFATTVTTALAGKQPLDSDLTAIAALTTTSFGRSFLALADAAAGRTLISAAAHDPSIQSVTSASTVTPTFSDDQVNITAQAAALTLANPTGTAIPAWGIVVRIKDNGTARAISYGTQYRPVGVSLPTTTVISKTLYLGMIYNSTDTKWDVVAVGQEV